MDAPETISNDDRPNRETIRSFQQQRLSQLLDVILPANRFYSRKLSDTSRSSAKLVLQALPFTTRGEIEKDQCDYPPYGTNLTYSIEHYTRLHQTSGSVGNPVRWLDTPDSWTWFKRCWQQVYAGAEVSPRDRIVFAFSFGPFIGFWGAFEAAVDLGNFCLAAGGMTTLARLQYLIEHQATVVCCTPTYALRMAEAAAGHGLDLAASAVKKLIVAGEPGGSVPATRAKIESAWGARVFDHAGMTEIGAWGFECTEAPGGMHIIESEFIAEVIDPQSTQAVADGVVGELVLTNLGRVGSPLIRYRTGDLVRRIESPCACGRSFSWVDGGVLGRVDDMLIIRGNNLFPSAIENFVGEFRDVAEFKIVVSDARPLVELELVIEPHRTVHSDQLASRVANAFRDRFHFNSKVTVVAPGSLPRSDMKARRLIRRTPLNGASGGVNIQNENR